MSNTSMNTAYGLHRRSDNSLVQLDEYLNQQFDAPGIAAGGDSQVVGGDIWPEGYLDSIATTGPTSTVPTPTQYFRFSEVLYKAPIELQGSITSVGTPDGGSLDVTIGGVSLTLISTEGLNKDIEYTVGASGVFQTISQGIDALYNEVGSYRVYNDGIAPEVTLRLLSGFVMSEQVWYESCDLSFIRITSDDATVTINRSALTRPVGAAVLRYMAFTFRNSCVAPKIDVLFSMDTSGVSTGRGGVRLENNSYGIFSSGAGVINAADRGLHLVNSSAIANSTNWYNAGERGIRVGNYSTIWAENANCTNCGESGIAVDSSGNVIIRNADVSDGGVYGLLVLRAAEVDAQGITANDCPRGVYTEGSRLNVQECEILRSTVDGLTCADGAAVSAKLSNISESTGNNILVRNGSVADIHNTTSVNANINVSVQTGSVVDGSNIIATGATSRGAVVTGGDLTITNADISGSGGAADLLISDGAVVRFNNGTGTFGLAINTPTEAGIVFRDV